MARLVDGMGALQGGKPCARQLFWCSSPRSCHKLPRPPRGGIKVLNSFPDAYWGTWAPGVGRPCKEGDTEAIVLSAKAYAGPLGKCDVASVSETLITPPSARQPGAPSWYLRTFRYPNLIKSWANR